MISGLYYPLFLALGLVISIEDWRQRRIRNLWIGAGLLLCAAGLGYLLVNSALGHRQMRFFALGEYYLPWHYYPRLLEHLALSLAAGVVLWRLSIWPAGDAKLFVLFSFFLALINPNLRGFPLLLFLVFLINIFVPAGLLMACEAAVRLGVTAVGMRGQDWRKSAKAFRERISKRAGEAWPRRGQYLILGFNLVILFFGLRLAERRFHAFFLGPFGQLGLFFAMALIWKHLVVVLASPVVGAGALIGFLAAAVCAPIFEINVGRILGDGLQMAASFWLLLSFGRIALHWLIERQSRRELDAGGLMAGTILSDETWNRLLAEKSLAGKLGFRYCDGLTAEEAQHLRTWLEVSPAEALTVYHSIPFAAWIFLGSVLTLSNRGTAVSWLAPYFHKGLGLLGAAGGTP